MYSPGTHTLTLHLHLEILKNMEIWFFGNFQSLEPQIIWEVIVRITKLNRSVCLFFRRPNSLYLGLEVDPKVMVLVKMMLMMAVVMMMV